MTSPGTALITGGSRGIGYAIAERLAARGHAVGLVARDATRLAEAERRLAAGGARVATFAADLRDPGAPDRVLREATERLGPVDALINNAGTAPSGKLERTTDEVLDEVLDLHVKAPFRFIRAALPGMKERGRGCIVQLASTAGLRGFALITAYAAAKHAMVGMARALAVELGQSPLRVYAVCPGFVDTDITRAGAAKVALLGKHTAEEVLAMYGAMNACGRLLLPAEIADVVAQLADPACTIPSGSICDMDDMPPVFRSPNRP
jgi:NAD(P)-dependent dehydrogenase (short-subunit alcohol dehydrogenase family)